MSSAKEDYENFMEYLLDRTSELLKELNGQGEEMKIPPPQRMWGCMMVLMKRSVDLAVRLPNTVLKKDFYAAFEKLYDKAKAEAAEAAAAADKPQETQESK
jgi:hypothetical protein